MEQTKEQLIADLYGLRACLSLISQKIDEKQEFEQKIEDEEKDIVYYDKWLKTRLNESENANAEVRSAKQEIEARKQALDVAIKADQHRKSLSYKEKREIDRNLINKKLKGPEKAIIEEPGIFTIIAAILGAIAASVFLCIIMGAHSFEDYFSFILMGIILGGIAGPILGWILFGLIYVPLVFRYRSAVAEKGRKEIVHQRDLEIENNIALAEKRLQEGEKELAQRKNAANERKETLKWQKNQTTTETKECNQRIAELKKKRNTSIKEIKWIDEQTIQMYSSAYAVTDWENLDMIIHYLQTGRADTLKEALQQVDRQKQTDEILQAIHGAGQFVAETVQTSMQQMGQALATSFSLISGQLSTIGAQLEQNNLQLQEGNEKLSQIISLSRANLLATGAMQKEIKEKLTLQIEAADLNNALIQKSNESSKDMIRELSSFKKELKSR